MFGRRLFESEDICLRPMEMEDLDFLYGIENDPGNWTVSSMSVPYSRFFLSQYIQESENDVFSDHQMRMIICLRNGGIPVGTLDMTDFSAQHRHAEVGIAILQEYRGRGYGHQALKLLEDYAFGFLHLKQLTARTLVSNVSSLELFRSCGYQDCGLLRSWWRTPRGFEDVAVLQLICGD